MEKKPWDSSDMAQGLPEKVELTKQQKDIYQFLLREKAQRAYAIAKAMGKTRASDVNPDLYKMQGWNLLDCNEDKLWSIKAESHASEHCHRSGRTKTGPLTDQQREIFTLLRKNKPMKAMDIAKGVGKTTAKDVNPDLYRMKNMNLLSHSEQEKLWTVKCEIDSRCTERSEDSEEPRRSSIPSDSNHTDDSTSLNQSEIEKQDNQFCNGSQCNNATGIASPDHRIVSVSSQNITQTPTCHNNVQNYANTTLYPTVVKHYNICIQNSQNFSVGDVLTNSGWSEEPAAGDVSPMVEACASQNATLCPGQHGDSEEASSTQTQDELLNVSITSDAEEIQRRPLHTSSPAEHDQCQRTINISSLCHGIEQLNLEQQDDHVS